MHRGCSVRWTERLPRNRTEQNRTGQNRTEQDRTEQDRTEQDRTGQNRTEQNRTGQDRTEQNRTEQNRTEQNRTEQNIHLADVPVLMMRPHLFALMCGIASCMAKKGALRCSAISLWYVSSGKLSIGHVCWMPALLHRMSMLPNSKQLEQTIEIR
jgi:hypothetical protein